MVTVAGTMVLIGWATGVGALQRLIPGSAPIAPNAALAFVLLGSAIFLAARPRQHAATRTVAALLVGAAVLVTAALGIESAAGRGLGIDRLLFGPHAPLPNSLPPVDPFEPITLLAVVLVGSAVILTPHPRWHRIVIGVSLTTFALAALSVFNALFGGTTPSYLASLAQLSAGTAALTMASSLAALLLLPSGGPLRLFGGRSPTARWMRSVSGAAIVVPIGLFALRALGEDVGLYGPRYGLSLMLVLTIGLLLAVAWWAGTAMRRAEDQRLAAGHELDRFFDLTPDMLATAGPDGRFIHLNPAWTATLGYTLDELRAVPFIELVHPEDREATIYETRRHFEQGKTVFRFQNRYRHRDGSYRWLEWTSQVAPDHSTVYAMARDVTLRKRDEERLERRAARLATRNDALSNATHRDPLTRLHNRRFLERTLGRLVNRWQAVPPSQREPIAAIMFDLDNFGMVNKQHGHQAGDLVLRRFGEILQRRFRGSDLLARYGGEEFFVLLVGATGADAVRAAEEVRRSLAETTVSLSGERFAVTVSAGCTELAEGMGVEELIAAADVGLALAKRAGRNSVVAT